MFKFSLLQLKENLFWETQNKDYYKAELEKAINGKSDSIEVKIEIDDLKRKLESKTLQNDELQLQVKRYHIVQIQFRKIVTSQTFFVHLVMSDHAIAAWLDFEKRLAPYKLPTYKDTALKKMLTLGFMVLK